MTTPLLVTITFSHYCEKARWALERAGIMYRESGHLPVFHATAVRRAGGQRATPCLVTDEGVISDSTDILKWADKKNPSAHLYGKNDAERRQIEELEDRFDEDLGPHTRRWVYFHILPDRKFVLQLCERGAPTVEHLAFPVFFPVARFIMRKAMNITRDGAERSFKKIESVFAEVDRMLADGRPYLVGDEPTAADITFATLAAVVLAPPEYSAKLPSIDALPAPMLPHMKGWIERPAGQFARRMFRDHRSPASARSRD